MKGLIITKWDNRYCKVRQVLQSGATLLQSRAVITKWGSTPSNGEWYEWSPILTDKANAG